MVLEKGEPNTTEQRMFPNFPHLSGDHPRATRLPAKLRLSMSWPQDLFLFSISLPLHAPTSASNAKGLCGKNAGAGISGGTATTTATFLRTDGSPFAFSFQIHHSSP